MLSAGNVVDIHKLSIVTWPQQKQCQSFKDKYEQKIAKNKTQHMKRKCAPNVWQQLIDSGAHIRNAISLRTIDSQAMGWPYNKNVWKEQ